MVRVGQVLWAFGFAGLAFGGTKKSTCSLSGRRSLANPPTDDADTDAVAARAATRRIEVGHTRNETSKRRLPSCFHPCRVLAERRLMGAHPVAAEISGVDIAEAAG